jgi:transposase
MNLLARYINQGRLDGDRPHLSPRRAARILLTRPDRLTGGQPETRTRLEAACPGMTALAALISSFAGMLTPARENEAGLQQRTARAREADLPHLRSFARGMDLDIEAVTVALTLPHHNGRTEGVNTKTNDQKTDVRTGRLRTAPPPDTPRLTLHTVTTEIATEPLARQTPARFRPNAT